MWIHCLHVNTLGRRENVAENVMLDSHKKWPSSQHANNQNRKGKLKMDENPNQDMRKLRHRVIKLPCFQQADHDVELQFNVSRTRSPMGIRSPHLGHSYERSVTQANLMGLGLLTGFSRRVFMFPPGTEQLLQKRKS